MTAIFVTGAVFPMGGCLDVKVDSFPTLGVMGVL